MKKYIKLTPENYRRYRPVFEPYKGDIVAFESNIYIDFPGGTWQDHFTRKTILATCADTVPSNSGRFKAKTKKKTFLIFCMFRKSNTCISDHKKHPDTIKALARRYKAI